MSNPLNDTPKLVPCTKCGTPKPWTAEYFPRQSCSSSGLAQPCRVCHNQDARDYGAQHKEQRKLYMTEYHARNKEKRKQRGREYYLLHRDEILANKAKHKDQTQKRDKERNQNNPEKVRMYAHKRRARKRELPATFAVSDWERALSYFNGACAYCGHGPSMFDLNWTLQQEHHIPLSKGGHYTPDNIIPACQSCNYSKKSKMPHEWLVEKFGTRKTKQIEQRIAEYFSTCRR